MCFQKGRVKIIILFFFKVKQHSFGSAIMHGQNIITQWRPGRTLLCLNKSNFLLVDQQAVEADLFSQAISVLYFLCAGKMIFIQTSLM